MNADNLQLPPHHARLGLWLGVLGVTIFALTLPMTRLAVGTPAAPQMSPWFVTFGRAALAGILSLIVLLVTRSPLPLPAQRKPLLIALTGNAIAYPLLLGFALLRVTASHAAVITALLPLVTAAVAAWVLHQRARLGFWVCASVGSLLVVVFSLLRADAHGQGFGLEWADWLLVGAVLAASLGYVYGARVTPSLGAERVICWVCVMALPITLPGALITWPAHPVNWSAWASLVYVGVFSMWMGFFAWYRGLAIGGALRVSQTQLLQPFISILAAVPILGEPLDLVTLGFALAVVATVFLGKSLATHPPAASAKSPPLKPAVSKIDALSNGDKE